MADFIRNSGGGKIVRAGSLSNALTAVTPSATANTKGAYAEIVASTPIAADALLFTVVRFGASGADLEAYLIDLAVGGAGSEQVIIGNIMYDMGEGGRFIAPQILAPLHVPAGSRLSARAQKDTVDQITVDVSVHLIPPGLWSRPSYSRCTTYGADTATSTGTLIAGIGTANVKSAWQEITAACTHQIRELWVNLCDDSRGNAYASYTARIDIGMGGAGSEVVLIKDLQHAFHTDTDTGTPKVFGPFPVDIPAGTRLAARRQSNITSLNDVDVVLLALG